MGHAYLVLWETDAVCRAIVSTGSALVASAVLRLARIWYITTVRQVLIVAVRQAARVVRLARDAALDLIAQALPVGRAFVRVPNATTA